MLFGPPENIEERNHALDGLRGVGALVVVLWHLAVAFFPCSAWGVEEPTSAPWERMLYESPLWVILNGTFAVCLFFVLSGYVLTVGHFRSGDARPLIHRIVGRPLRLGVLAAVSTVAIWLGSLAAPSTGAEIVVPVLKATGALDAIRPHLNLDPDLSLQTLFENIFWFPWFQPSKPRDLYNGVLWTMHVELLGSFLVMTLALVLSHAKTVWLAASTYLVCGAIMMIWLPGSGIYFAIFLCGSAIAAVDPPKWRTVGWKRNIPIVAAIFGLLLGACRSPALSIGTEPVGAVFSYGNVIVMGLGAVAFFLSVLVSDELSKLFSGRAFALLGRVSFSLYVCHAAVIFSVGTTLFLFMGPEISIEVRSITAAVASLAVSVGLAIVLAVWIDAPSIRLARSFSRAVLK